MQPLSIIAYLDGRAGHEKQTRAILQALTDLTKINIVYKKVAVSRAAYCRNLARYLIAFAGSSKNWHLSAAADLIIGTGTYTHLPMLTEKKIRLKAHNKPLFAVTCMTPEPFLRNSFDLCCIPAHDEPTLRENIFVTLGPPTPRIRSGKHESDRGLILVGGTDRKSHIWDTGTVAGQIRTVIKKNQSIQWTVSSSPRTPAETCIKLEKLASELNFIFIRSEDTPSGWVEGQYAVNKSVWVTADSVSMMYEALNAGCSVGVLPVEWIKPENKFQKGIDLLKTRRLIVDFEDWQNGAPMPDQPADQFNEAGRCAREILKRWWPERLQ